MKNWICFYSPSLLTLRDGLQLVTRPSYWGGNCQPWNRCRWSIVIPYIITHPNFTYYRSPPVQSLVILRDGLLLVTRLSYWGENYQPWNRCRWSIVISYIITHLNFAYYRSPPVKSLAILRDGLLVVTQLSYWGGNCQPWNRCRWCIVIPYIITHLNFTYYRSPPWPIISDIKRRSSNWDTAVLLRGELSAMEQMQVQYWYFR